MGLSVFHYAGLLHYHYANVVEYDIFHYAEHSKKHLKFVARLDQLCCKHRNVMLKTLQVQIGTHDGGIHDVY